MSGNSFIPFVKVTRMECRWQAACRRLLSKQIPDSFKLPCPLLGSDIFWSSLRCSLHFTLTTNPLPSAGYSCHIYVKCHCVFSSSLQWLSWMQDVTLIVVSVRQAVLIFQKAKWQCGRCCPLGTLTTTGCSEPNVSKLYGLHLHLHKIQTQCKPDCLQMWSERSDHNVITTHVCERWSSTELKLLNSWIGWRRDVNEGWGGREEHCKSIK